MSSTLQSIAFDVGIGSIADAVDSIVRIAAFRGVTFHMTDGQDEVGRRLLAFLFPGQDAPQFQDLGALDGQVPVTGLIIGDDWQVKYERLRRAFRTAGPATLLHPWIGQIKVLLSKPARFSFSERERRCVRFDASFVRWQSPPQPAADSLGGLLERADAAIDDATLTLANTLSSSGMPIGFIGVVGNFLGGVSSMWSGLLGGGSGSSDFLAACGPSLDALLAGVPGGPASVDADGDSYAQQVSDLLTATPAAIAGVVLTLPEPAVAPGGIAVQPDAIAVDPRAAATLLLRGAAIAPSIQPVDPTSIIVQVLSATAPGSPAPALALAARANVLAQAASVVSSIDFDSQQDAMDWHARIDGALASLQSDAAALAADDPAGVGKLWRSVGALRAAISADMNAQVGRLPAVATLLLPTTMSAWQVALRISGDDPAGMLADYRDVVRRNGVRNPALVPAGPIEILQAVS